MIKNILIALDGSSYSLAAASYGIWLAKGFKAKLTGMHTVDVVMVEGPLMHDISGSLGFEPFLNFSGKMREVLEAAGREILESFKKECDSAGVENETVLAYGIVANEICEKARLDDLVVIGRRGVNARFEYGLLGSTVERVIRRSPEPVFITPQRFLIPTNPLLCYDGSPHAAKTLHTAAEFVKTLALPLTVLAASKDGSAHAVLKEAEDYLVTHGIKGRFVNITGEPHAVIKKYHVENNHDLLFMGATHHSRLAAMALGGTTEYVMRSVDGPFLLER